MMALCLSAKRRRTVACRQLGSDTSNEVRPPTQVSYRQRRSSCVALHPDPIRNYNSPPHLMVTCAQRRQPRCAPCFASCPSIASLRDAVPGVWVLLPWLPQSYHASSISHHYAGWQSSCIMLTRCFGQGNLSLDSTTYRGGSCTGRITPLTIRTHNMRGNVRCVAVRVPQETCRSHTKSWVLVALGIRSLGYWHGNSVNSMESGV
jgi:hypothetical protein